MEQRGIKNLKPVRLDINGLSLQALGEREKFDRVISIECLEHSRNYKEVFAAVCRMVTPDAVMFVQILCHREYSYQLRKDNWMVLTLLWMFLL